MRGRNFGLDVLRCLAVLIVLGNHAFVVLWVGLAHVPFTGVPAAISVLTFESVEWLFVLSGFLLGAIWIRTVERAVRPSDVWRFWVRRWMRTLPAYYIFLGANLWLRRHGVGPGTPSPSYWIFSQALLHRVPEISFFPEAWSLALDEWFYFLLPLLTYPIARFVSTKKAILVTTALLILVPTLARALHTPSLDYKAWDCGIRRVTLFRLDSAGWGVLAAAASQWWPDYWNARPGRKLGVAVLLLLGGYAAYVVYLFTPVPSFAARLIDTFALAFISIGSALMIPAWMRLRSPRPLIARFFSRVSDYTYVVYLCHLPMLLFLVYQMIMRAMNQPWSMIAIWLTAVAVVSPLVFHIVEQPMRWLRERIAPRTASPF